jgi:hypothetical protein
MYRHHRKPPRHHFSFKLFSCAFWASEISTGCFALYRRHDDRFIITSLLTHSPMLSLLSEWADEYSQVSLIQVDASFHPSL